MPRPQDTRAVLLARVSSREQAEGYSLDAQLGLLREHAARHGLTVTAEHAIAESASGRRERTRFQAILAELRRPNAPRHLVVEKVDRLTRNQRDVVAVDDLRLAGLRVHLVREGIVLSPESTSQQLLVWDVHAMMARHYTRNLSEETRKGMREKARQGGWSHRAPIGYLNDVETRRLVHDAERAPLVRQLFDRVLADSLNAPEAARFAASIGLRSRDGLMLGRAAVLHLLSHPLLGGYVPHGGDWPNAKRGRRDAEATLSELADCEPVVPRETWHRVQALLASRRRGRAPKSRPEGSPAIFAGLVRCATCSRLVSPEVHRRGSRVHVYYRCPDLDHRRHRVAERDLVAATARALRGLTLDAGHLPTVREQLRRANQATRQERATELARLATTEARLEERLGRAADAYVEGRLGDAELALVRTRVTRERAALATRRQALSAAGDAWIDDVTDALRVLSGAAGLFPGAARERQRRLVGLLFDGLTLDAGRLVAPLAEPWSRVELALADRVVNELNATSAEVSVDFAPMAPHVARLLNAATVLRDEPAAVAALLGYAA